MVLAAQAQQTKTTKLIIRADDMGSSHASNEACIETATKGIATSIEVMAVAPWFPEAVRMLNDNPILDVGLHLVITSEWDNIKWRPLTNCPSLTDSNGYFLPMMGPNPNYPGLSVMENNWKPEEIEQEFRAQVELALKNIPRISHISGHMGSIGFDEKVAEMTHRLAETYHLIDDTDLEKEGKLMNVGYEGDSKTSSEKKTAFLAMLNKLDPGKTYLFVDHPAYDNAEMQAVHHIGYENVATDRQGVTDLFTDPEVKKAIQEKGIELVSYKQAFGSIDENIKKQ